MEKPDWKLSISMNPDSGEFDLHVEPDSVFVGLSLAALVDRVLRRAEARAEAIAQLDNARIVFPGALPATKGPLG